MAGKIERRRWPWIAGGVLLSIVLVLIVFEAAGWPFLAGPLQRFAAQTLDRRVMLSGESGDRVRLGFLGGVHVQAPTLEVGAPAWSEAAHMVLAHDVDLRLRYLDLWHAWRGDPLRIRSLRDGDIDASLERGQDGRASWTFHTTKP
jgi:uncharacterized protein involved in outer membrane biogenesis